MKHVDLVMAGKKAASKWVGGLRLKQSSPELNSKVNQLKQDKIIDEQETLETVREKVQKMKDQVESLRNGWSLHGRKLCDVTEEVTLSNSRTIDTLEVIEFKLIQKVKEDIEKYKQVVIDAHHHQIEKIETAYNDLQEKMKSLEEFVMQLDEAIGDSAQNDIKGNARTLKEDFTAVMNRNKVTELQMKIYKTFEIVQPDSFKVLVTGWHDVHLLQ